MRKVRNYELYFILNLVCLEHHINVSYALHKYVFLQKNVKGDSRSICKNPISSKQELHFSPPSQALAVGAVTGPFLTCQGCEYMLHIISL